MKDIKVDLKDMDLMTATLVQTAVLQLAEKATTKQHAQALRYVAMIIDRQIHG